MKELLRKPIKLQRKTMIIIFICLAGIIFASVAIPKSISNGVEQFTGIEREAAEEALKSYDDVHRSPMTTYLKLRAVAVYPTPSNEKCQDNRDSDSPEDLRYYTVRIVTYGFFGRAQQTVEQEMCRILG